MANPWFRFYSEFANDPKVQLMSEAMQRRLAMIMCLRCAEQLGSDKQIAWSLRISPSEAEETKQLFIENGFIDENWSLVHWEERQFSSDSSYQRVKKYRDKRQAAGLSRGSSHLQDKLLYDRDCNRCIYCGSGENLCIDHIFPISQGGTDHLDNLGVACKSCNSGKAGKTPSQSNLRIMTKEAQDRFDRYVTVTSLKDNSDSHGTEQNRTEQSRTETTPKPKASENGFTQKIYQAYPRHVAPKAAFKAIQKVISQNDPQAILETVENFARKHRSLGTESKFIPHPATYFNQGRYADEE